MWKTDFESEKEQKTMLAVITPLGSGSGSGEYPDQGLPGSGGHPSHPIVLPPLPGIWPKPGEPSHPIALPPGGYPSHPIFITESPENPIQLPPATIWPPLPYPPTTTGKYAILVLVVGVGHRWLIVDAATTWPPPSLGQPKS